MASAGPVAVLAAEPVIDAVEAVEPDAIPLLDEDPAVDTPEWAELYARTVERHREERDRIDREQAEAQRLWEEFLAAQGADLPEGQRSLAENDQLHHQMLELACPLPE